MGLEATGPPIGLQRALAAAVEMEGAVAADGAEGDSRPVPRSDVDAVADAAAGAPPVPAALPLAQADACAHALLSYMRRAPTVERVELAGECRRRCDTVARVDLLAVAAHPEPVRQHFARWPDAADVSLADPTHASLRLPCGVRAELRIVPRRCFGATLQYLTGSAAHNAALRALGLERGIRLSEYGVFRFDHARAGARRLGGQREEDVYEALDLDWIPPEIREGNDELARAADRTLPALVTAADLRGDLHLAPRTSGDVAEMVRACERRGYAWCAVAAGTAGSPGTSRRARDMVEAIQAARESVSLLDVRLAWCVGVGDDGTPQLHAEPDPADLVILAPPRRGSRASATERLLRAMEHDVVTVVAGLGAQPGGGTAVDVDAVIERAIERGLAVELCGPSAGVRLDDGALRRAVEGGLLLALTSRAHTADTVGDIRFAVDRARRGWVARDSVINARAECPRARPPAARVSP